MVSHFLRIHRQNLPCTYLPGSHFLLPFPPLNASKLPIPQAKLLWFSLNIPQLQLNNQWALMGINLTINCRITPQISGRVIQMSSSFAITSLLPKKMFRKHHPGRYRGYGCGLNLRLHRKVPPSTDMLKVLNKEGLCTQ